MSNIRGAEMVIKCASAVDRKQLTVSPATQPKASVPDVKQIERNVLSQGIKDNDRDGIGLLQSQKKKTKVEDPSLVNLPEKYSASGMTSRPSLMSLSTTDMKPPKRPAQAREGPPYAALRANLGMTISEIATEVELLSARDLINKRLQGCIAQWERRNYRKLDAVESVAIALENLGAGKFPSGFGFHLVDDRHYSKQSEPELSKLYDVVMTLEDEETQDFLLCFVDDFRIKREVLRTVQQNRSKLTRELQLWMQKVQAMEIQDVVTLAQALQCEQQLGQTYFATLSAIRKLKAIKTGMDRIVRQSSKKLHTNPVEVKHLKDCLSKFPACGDVLKIIKNEKDAVSDTEAIDTLVDLTEQLAKSSHDQEAAMKSLKMSVELKKSELRLLGKSQTACEKEQMVLKLRLKELENLKLAEDKAKSAIKLAKSLHTAANRTNAGVQTDRHLLADKGSKRGSGRVLKSRKATRDESPNKDMTDSTTEEETVQKSRTSSVKRLVIKDRHRFYASGVPNLLDDDPSISQTECHISSSIDSVEWAKPKQRSESDTADSRMAVKSHKRKKKTSCQSMLETSASAPDTESTDTVERGKQIPEEHVDKLNLMSKDLREVLMLHVKSLYSKFLKLRGVTRQELDLIRTKERKLEALGGDIFNILSSLQLQCSKLPVVSMTSDRVEVQNLAHSPHHCRLCTCHLQNSKVVLDTTEMAEAVGRTLTDCQVYTSLLGQLKERYELISMQLTEAQDYIISALSELPWSHVKKHPSKNRSSLLTQDTEVNIEDLISSLEQEEKVDDVHMQMTWMWELSQAVACMIRHLIDVKRTMDERLLEVEEEHGCLMQVEWFFEKAESLLQDMVLTQCRHRCRQDVNLYGKLLLDVRCPFCRCYNSPFHDGLRDFGTSNLKEMHMKSLIHVVSLMKQGRAAVQVMVEDEDGALDAVLGVSPDKLEDLDQVQASLLEAASLCCPHTQEFHFKRAHSHQ